MPAVHEVQHPLIQHHLAKLRDKTTRPDEFRRLIQRLASLLAYEATRDLSTQSLEIETPLTRISAQQLSQRIGLVPSPARKIGTSPILCDNCCAEMRVSGVSISNDCVLRSRVAS